jgi:hypothetical protein
MNYVEAGALIKGQFRYALTRRWGSGPALLWIMLNPSTADGEQDDPTIRRVVSFTNGFGHFAAVIANLFALRATNPGELLTAQDPVGPENDRHLSDLLIDHPVAICAWGAVHPKLRWRIDDIRGFLVGHGAYCLGKTQRGDPRHPLYLAKNTPLITWPLGDLAMRGGRFGNARK